MKKEFLINCGYCNENFKQFLTVDNLDIPQRDSIICPRCDNFISKKRILETIK